MTALQFPCLSPLQAAFPGGERWVSSEATSLEAQRDVDLLSKSLMGGNCAIAGELAFVRGWRRRCAWERGANGGGIRLMIRWCVRHCCATASADDNGK